MRKLLKHKTKIFISIFAALVIAFSIIPSLASPVYAGKTCGGSGNSVNTEIDLGCTGSGNPIADLTFAIIRLMVDGVGIVVIASIVVAGIQYSTSRGDPQAAAAAINRIQSAVIALVVYIFAFALLQWLIPGGFFNGSSSGSSFNSSTSKVALQ